MRWLLAQTKKKTMSEQLPILYGRGLICSPAHACHARDSDSDWLINLTNVSPIVESENEFADGDGGRAQSVVWCMSCDKITHSQHGHARWCFNERAVWGSSGIEVRRCPLSPWVCAVNFIDACPFSALCTEINQNWHIANIMKKNYRFSSRKSQMKRPKLVLHIGWEAESSCDEKLNGIDCERVCLSLNHCSSPHFRKHTHTFSACRHPSSAGMSWCWCFLWWIVWGFCWLNWRVHTFAACVYACSQTRQLGTHRKHSENGGKIERDFSIIFLHFALVKHEEKRQHQKAIRQNVKMKTFAHSKFVKFNFPLHLHTPDVVNWLIFSLCSFFMIFAATGWWVWKVVTENAGECQ